MPDNHTEIENRPSRVRVSVVTPCYNEENSINELHRRVSAVCRDVVGSDYELVLVNDGSRDKTWLAMMLLAEHDPRVTAVNLSRNHGHQLALTAGLSVCRGERISSSMLICRIRLSCWRR